MEWCIWWLQQHGDQQQRGQLYLMLVVVRSVAAALVRAIRRGSEAAERSFGDHVRVGRPCLWRVILPPSNGSCASLSSWLRTFGGFVLTYVARCAHTYAVAVAALPL